MLRLLADETSIIRSYAVSSVAAPSLILSALGTLVCAEAQTKMFLRGPQATTASS
jgi:hypothetical protein